MRYSLASIDPGSIYAAVAFWAEGELVKISVIDRDGIHLDCAIVDTAKTAVLEKMAWYPGRPNSSPKDLIEVSLFGAYVAGRLTDGKVTAVLPQVWKGSVSKAISHKRIESKLRPAELVVLHDYLDTRGAKKRQLDVMDAIGIGLWQLRR
jgi:hypothetical protein